MATFSASAAVGEVLRQPDDLLKLTTYRNKLLKEKAALDNKLQEGVRSQLDATRQALLRLQESRAAANMIRDDMTEIEKLMNTKDESDVFQKITRVSAVHRNFAQTAKMVEQLQSMADKVDYLGRLLDDDRSQGPISDAPHLLPIHFQLQQLESFRNETMAEAKRGNREEREILTRWFEPLDVLIKEFEGWMWELASNVVELARQGYGGTVVRLVKIIEFEGREDEKTVALRLVRKVGNDAARLRGVQGNARPIKNYRHKFLDAIEKNIKGKFADHYDRNELDLLGFIDGLDFMYKDIIRIKDDVEHLFPPDFEAVKWLIHRYHLALDEVLKKVVSSAPEAQVLLELYAWTKEYTRSMKELEVPSEWLQPPLLDGKAGDLLEDYVRLIITKLEEWTVNLQKQETAKFRTRTEEPSRGTDGLFGMDGVVDFFSIVNQQIDLALDSNQGAVLARVVTEVSKVQRRVQSEWVKLMSDEAQAQAEKRPEEVAGGLVEYVMALANDQLRAADFTEALQNRLEPLVSDKYKPTIVDRFNEAIDGYLDVAKQCTGTLVQFVFNDLRPATRQFMQSGWYNDQLMPQIIETMRDYMGDYQSHLNPSIFEIVIEDLLDAFLITYLTALRRAPPNSLRMPGAVQRLRSDISQVFDFFTLYKPPEELEPSFEIMDQVASMLSASPQMVFMDYWNFAKTHGPQLQFVEAIMRARDDLERGETNEVMDTLKRKVRDEGIEDPQEPTIMVSYVEPTPTDKQVKVLGASGAASLMANISAYAGTMASKAKGMRSERDRERF
ncbi:vesicle fusion-related protein [Trichosporon asahii var. asahii CBS 8904]|uniref:Vesicle fusion-related protein n=1 Tax=Trichosporon asahii var. asahii (strain CBS 8904) TaxID=1220162 RepID=K1VJS2_TRIAC|nr:vesicle fusion-related protein [Trichosporon asahii var. asahii CBS 8904]